MKLIDFPVIKQCCVVFVDLWKRPGIFEKLKIQSRTDRRICALVGLLKVPSYLSKSFLSQYSSSWRMSWSSRSMSANIKSKFWIRTKQLFYFQIRSRVFTSMIASLFSFCWSACIWSSFGRSRFQLIISLNLWKSCDSGRVGPCLKRGPTLKLTWWKRRQDWRQHRGQFWYSHLSMTADEYWLVRIRRC